MVDKDQLFLVGIGLCVGVVIGAGGMGLSRRAEPAPIVILPPEATATAVATATPGPVRVFVSGQVVQPDVYELPPGGLVADAVERAGGFTRDANAVVLNLAQPLLDGMQIYVPSLTETAVVPLPIVSAPQQDAGETAVTEESGLVDINVAGLDELDTLPGIGPSTAQKIIEYRDANGLFVTIDEIMNVSGIGEAKFAQISPFITVGDP